MSRTPFLAGNWKLHKDPAASRALAEDLRTRLAGVTEATIAVFPTAISLSAVTDMLANSNVAVGVQEIEGKPEGAFTGANSAVHARKAGCTYTLVGHSERRQRWGETDASCSEKLAAALSAGLLPIYCVGETLEERRAGKVEAIVFRQLADGLRGLAPDQVGSLTLAYEPVWAIGTGETASPEQAQAVHRSIRQWLETQFGPAIAGDMRLQYGGSVKPDNARELLSCPDIDGALVGGASLDAASFEAIVRAAL